MAAAASDAQTWRGLRYSQPLLQTWSITMTTVVSRLFLALAALVCVALDALPAQAQNTRSWVSGNGSDGNPCTRAAPCLSFFVAQVFTNAGGIINSLHPGDFGALTITKAITIDCTGTTPGIAK